MVCNFASKLSVFSAGLLGTAGFLHHAKTFPENNLESSADRGGSGLPCRGRAGASVELSSEMLSLSFSLTMSPHVADALFLGFGSSCRIQCPVSGGLYSGWLRFQLRESIISCSVPVLASTHILCKWGYFDFLPFLFVPFCLLPFSYCSNKTSSLILNESGESRHLCPDNDLSGNASRFPHSEYNVGYRFIIFSMFYFEICFFYSESLQDF